MSEDVTKEKHVDSIEFTINRIEVKLAVMDAKLDELMAFLTGPKPESWQDPFTWNSGNPSLDRSTSILGKCGECGRLSWCHKDDTEWKCLTCCYINIVKK